MEPIYLELLEQAVMVIAGLIFSALGALGSYYISKLVNHLREQEKLEIVSRYVRWAEQAPAFKDFPGEQKFEMVFSMAMQWLEDHGIPVDEDELAVMIENAVKLMKEAAAPMYAGE